MAKAILLAPRLIGGHRLEKPRLRVVVRSFVTIFEAFCLRARPELDNTSGTHLGAVLGRLGWKRRRRRGGRKADTE